MKMPVVAALMILAAPALAQTPEATAKATTLVSIVNPAAKADAQVAAQVKAMRSGALIRGVLSQNPQVKMELAKNQPATNAGIERLGTAQADAMAPILKEMAAFTRQAQINSYATNFTAAELDQLITFYRSAAGAKLLARQGRMGQDVAKEAQTRFGPRVQAAEKSFMTKVQAELPKMFPALAKPK